MRATLCYAVVLLSTAAIPCAQAQNLVQNGEFDANVGGWISTGTDLSIEWDPSDYAGSPSSGSLLATNSHAAAAYYAAWCCVDSLADGKSYTLSGWIRKPSGQTASGWARIYWYWRSSPSCGGTQTLSQSTSSLSDVDAWTFVSTESEVAPEGTMSAQVVVYISKTSATPGTSHAYFDGLDFRVTGSIFIDGLEGGSTAAWSNTVP
jgi:hypothetical protein